MNSRHPLRPGVHDRPAGITDRAAGTLPPCHTYLFGGFRLDQVGRELRHGSTLVGLPASALDCLAYLIEHRQRAVGRDELIVAVWGRADVSETLLPHTIVRLRKALGDTGSEQHAIRTVPRVGYRWVMEVSVESVAGRGPASVGPVPVESDPVACDDGAEATKASGVPDKLKLWKRIVAAAGVMFVGGLLALTATRTPDAGISPSPSVVVLPAEVHSQSGDWTWLRLGLMDLIANRLRDAHMQTVPSESVVALLEDNPGGGAAALSEGRTVLRPDIIHADGIWTVRIDARLPDGSDRVFSAQSADVQIAARNVADTFLVNSGGNPLPGVNEGVDPRLDLLQRLRSARLADRLDVAQDLARRSPAKLLADPEVQLAIARVDCDSGRHAACEQAIEAILDGPRDALDVRVRAGALVTRGWLHEVRGDHTNAEAALSEAVSLLPARTDCDVLAQALSLRGWVRLQQSRLDEAAKDLDTARGAYVTVDDPLGVARVDRGLAALRMAQGRYDAALALHQSALHQFERLGATREMPISLASIADVTEKQLRFDEQLRTTSLFWTPEHYDDPILASLRGWALARNGRLTEAMTIAQRQVARSDAKPAVLALHVLMAYIALERGNTDQAAAEARASLDGGIAEVGREEFRQAWVLLVAALVQGGDMQQAREAHDRMSQTTAVVGDALGQCYVAWLKARIAWHEGPQVDALTLYAKAMDMARAIGQPEIMVEVGADYGHRLLDAGLVDDVLPIEGTLSRWFDTDVRAAALHARIAEKLNRADVAAGLFERARRLAGERELPEVAR